MPACWSPLTATRSSNAAANLPKSPPLRHLGILSPVRGRTVPRLMDAESLPVDRSFRFVLRVHPGMLCGQRSRRRYLGHLTAAALSLLMSEIYTTINSKGISCLPKSEHGAGAGVILLLTCISAVLAPLVMGAISDRMGGPVYGFVLATGFAPFAVHRTHVQLDLQPDASPVPASR